MSLLLLDPSRAHGLFPPEQGKLHIDGMTFRTEDNALWQWRGISMFLLFLRYCRGEDIRPDLRWCRAMGFNILRVFGPLPWKETPDYRIENFRFDLLPYFFELLQSHGLRCNWSLAHYEHPGLKAHVKRWYEIASEFWCPVAEGVNEPHVGNDKPDPEELLDNVDRYGILSSYGLYGSYYAKPASYPPVLDFGTVHIPRDSAWHRKARHAQELQAHTGKPWISDEPAKITEPGFDYPGGKNDPKMTPAEMSWHGGVCCLWTPGFTFHCEEGKWGRVPRFGMLQHTVAEAVRENVFLKMDASWQTGEYNHSGNGDSPVDDVNDPNGNPIWTYTSLHATRAVSVRCGLSEPKAKNGWRIIDKWAPSHSMVRLVR